MSLFPVSCVDALYRRNGRTFLLQAIKINCPSLKLTMTLNYSL